MGIEQKIESMVQDFVQAYNCSQQRFGWQAQMRVLPYWKRLYPNSPEKEIAEKIEEWAINCSRTSSTRNFLEITQQRKEELRNYILKKITEKQELQIA